MNEIDPSSNSLIFETSFVFRLEREADVLQDQTPFVQHALMKCTAFELFLRSDNPSRNLHVGMSNLQNITFGDRDTTHLQYSGNWFLSGSYNASNVGQTGTLSSTSDLTAKVTFAFPQPVVAFYYFGIPRCCGGQYGICIDCDPNNPNFITIDAVNRTDDGHNPPVVLFSKVFDTPGLHEIIITNELDPRFGKSQLTIASIVLEVEGSDGGGGSNPVVTTTKVPPTVTTNVGSSTSSSSSRGAEASSGSVSSKSGSSSSSVTGTGTAILTRASGSTSSSPTSSDTAGLSLDNGSSSSSHPSIGAIVGGVLAALAFFLFVIILAFWLRLRRRRRAAATLANGPGLPSPNIYPSSSIIQPFTQYPQGSQMTQSETATPATTSLSSSPLPPPVPRGLDVGKHRRSAHPGQGQGVLQSVSTFSDATGSSAPTGSTPRREIDGGPLYDPVYAEDDTLPPDYRDVFASRRNTRRTVTTPSVHTQAMSETSSSARGQANSEASVSARGGGLSVSDLSPVRRKS